MDNNFEEDGDEIVGDEIIDDAMEIDEEEFFEPAHIIFMNDAGFSNDAESPQMSSSETSVDEIAMVNFAPEQQKALNEFSFEKHSKELLTKTNNKDLLAFLNAHWRLFTPICFNAMDTPTKNLIETRSNQILLKPLEVYICNSLDSDKALDKLNEFDDPPQLCGKVFKAGEPSYFCRDCGSDPTCVLCSNCFRRSKHREHRYKMMTSGGGGYCDCGDPEAWKQYPCCELHTPTTRAPTDPDSPESYQVFIDKLPKDLIQRATELFQILIEYVFEILGAASSEELPSHLKPEIQSDDYVTMLYNDEVHSYDQVTSTLRKVLVIDDKKAFEYAAIVDKEGRSAIKRGKKIECDTVKDKVEHAMSGPISNALETKVMHHSLVAHQYFAEKIIVWLQKICEMSKGLKHILCKISLNTTSNNQSVIENLMLSDSRFWKSARSIMHQFFISVFFMDPYWKKEFAVLYTKNYKLIWRNHVKNPDDTVSLTDLAVQLFTVGSLAKYLIANYNLLATIMETLIEHCKTNKGKLSFPRTRQRMNPEFRRAQFILLDLKYSLTTIPTEWTESLRKNFIAGFKSFVEFMKFMHGMDGLKRLTQQHIEYEPEWETSFNLLIKLQKSIASLIDWCASDPSVFKECFRYLIHAIVELESTDEQFKYKYDKVKFNSNSYEIIDYSVMRQEVSIHAPLTRLLSAMFAQQRDDMRVPIEAKLLGLIEPSLRALCLVYQTNNGFWKRNGFSLLSQVYFYSNIKCRFEMFDRDVLCLQMGLAQMDSNEFLIDILHRFGLYQFLIDENFELSTLENQTDDMKSEYLLPMSEDFFELLIILVSERYESFISQIDPIKKMEREVIHQLCISSLAHSDLVKNIYPDNEKYTNDLESVLNRIATFKNSTSTKGVYELKEEYRSYYSPYFYHFSRTDKTKSEEYQMSLRKNEREKFFSPPRLPPLTKLFANMSHLLDCDVFIKIIFTVLRRFHAKSKLANEGQLLRVLYLIGLALHEEQDEVDKKFSSETTSQSDFKFLEKSVLLINQSSSSSSSGSKKSSLLSLAKSLTKGSKDEAALTLTKVLTDVNNLVSANNNPQAKLLVEWVMEYSHRLLKLKHKIDEEKHLAGENVVVAESSATTAAAAATDESSSLKEKRKNQIAEKSRAKVMAKLNKMQKNFMENYKDLYEETKSLGNVVDTSPTATSSKLTAEFHTGDENKVVCIGPDQNQPPKSEKKRFVCILCQEEDQLSFTSSPMVLCCYVQSSKVLSKNRMETIDDFDNFDPLYMKNTLAWGINTTSCGHVMHAVCWQKHVETVRIAENRRHVRYMGYNIKRNEYLCPLCETIGNTVLPLFPNLAELTNLAKEQPKETKESEEKALSETKRKHIELSYDDWLDGLEKTLENSIKKELHDDKDVFIINPCPLSTITKLLATSVASNFRTLFEFDFDYSMTSMLSPSVLSLSPSSQSQSQSQSQQQSQQPAASTSMVCSLVASATESNSDIKLHAETVTTMENFARISYTYGFATFPNDDDYRMPISVWTNCAYTIQVIEQLLSFESKPLFGRFSVKQVELLSSIVKQAALYGMTKNTESVRKNCVRLLALILPYNKTALIDEAKSIIEIDMFHLLVSLCLSMPNLYEETPKLSLVSNGGLNDFNVFKLVLQAHCVQVFLAKLKYSSFCSEDESKSVCEEFDVREHDVDSVYEFFRYLFGLTVEKNILKFTDEEKVKITTKIKKIDVYVSLVKGLMPFLRCSALFFSNLTGLAPIAQISGNIDQFYELLAYLGVTKGLDSILETKTNGFKILCNSWLSLIGQSCQAKSEKAIKIDYPIPVNHFIDLPNDFVDLISMSMPPHQCSSRTSSLVDTSAESATILCLICGEMLCSQQFCCPKEIFKKRVGCCTAHAYECSGSVGVFLRVAECQVLLMQLNMNSQEDMQVRGCFVPAPYLDDYGETDQGLRRGNPLHLCKVRYNKLYKDWLSHAIPEEISRSYQNQTNNININWVDF